MLDSPFGALIVDDQDDVRLLLRAFIETANRGLYVHGEAADGSEAVARTRELQPSVIVMDHMMPNMTGLEAARLILEENPDQLILMCTAYLNAGLVAEAEALGIPCVPKERMSEVPQLLREMQGH